MFERLQKKWKVNGAQLVLVLCTFAIGGSLTGYLGKKIMNVLAIDQRVLWVLVYIIVVTLVWPFMVLLVSIPFGQFRFFINYLKKMGNRIGIGKKSGEESRDMGAKKQLTAGNQQLVRLAIFASGAGSNAQKLINHFKGHDHIKVSLIVCNKPQAGVLQIADREGIPYIIIEKEKFFRGNTYVDELKKQKIGFIVLAGFLWKVPDQLIAAYPSGIVNIHPALLPKYGGKGMYGQFVHEAVIAAGEKESGITIHYVDGHYDNGDIIFQATCPVLPTDDVTSLANRIHQLEHQHYPEVVEKVALKSILH